MDKNNLNIAMHVNSKFNRNRATRAILSVRDVYFESVQKET